MLRFLGKRAENLPEFIPQAVHLPITTGAIFIFWTWLCLAFADVGAYFVGRNTMKDKTWNYLSCRWSNQPQQKCRRFLGGCAVIPILAIIGAWVQKWPYWIPTGTIHGCMLALLGLIGDLTASMLKRDAGLKDFGDLIPEHGGVHWTEWTVSFWSSTIQSGSLCRTSFRH
jgi:CDP-diglyceride synthetase